MIKGRKYICPITILLPMQLCTNINKCCEPFKLAKKRFLLSGNLSNESLCLQTSWLKVDGNTQSQLLFLCFRKLKSSFEENVHKFQTQRSQEFPHDKLGCKHNKGRQISMSSCRLQTMGCITD